MKSPNRARTPATPPLVENFYFASSDDRRFSEVAFFRSHRFSCHLEGNFYLRGNVYGHPGFKEGESIESNKIVKVDKNNFVYTDSGSVYRLGRPRAGYLPKIDDYYFSNRDGDPIKIDISFILGLHNDAPNSYFGIFIVGSVHGCPGIEDGSLSRMYNITKIESNKVFFGKVAFELGKVHQDYFKMLEDSKSKPSLVDLGWKLDKYFFSNGERTPLLVDNPSADQVLDEKIYLTGLVYDHFGFEDGTTVMTRRITKIENEKAFTENGFVYQLGEMHPDYVEMVDAYERGLPIVWDWELKYETSLRCTLHFEYPEDRYYYEYDDISQIIHFCSSIGRSGGGVRLVAKPYGHEALSGTIIAQKGNTVTIFDNYSGREVECFIVWRSIYFLSRHSALDIYTGEGSFPNPRLSLEEGDFEDAFLLGRCRPNFSKLLQ